MAKVKMSIHRALSEIKTYDDRIRNAINSEFIVSNKKSNDKINGKTIEEVRSSIQGNFDSVKSLIENKKRIKSAIVASNAITEVSIGGEVYKVSDAIERKNMIALEEEFLRTLRVQFMKERNKVNSENDQLNNKLEQFLNSILGDKSSRTPQEIEEHTKGFMSRNTYELIDPNKIESYIKELENKILNFKTEVDYVLSESNSLTHVEVELCD